MSLHHAILSRIERHLEAEGESAASFGKRVANDPCLVGDLRAGRSVRIALADRILEATGGPLRGEELEGAQ